MSRRLLVRAVVLLFGGLVSAVLMSLAGSFVGGGTAHAGVATSCSTTSGAASVTLGDGVTTLNISGGNLQASDGTASSCGPASSVTSIAFAVGTGAAPTQVIFDQTGGVFPCAPLSGSLGNVPLQVTAVTGASPILFGTSGVSLFGCSATDTLGGASSYTVLLTGSGSSTGPITVSAAGGSGTGNPTSATLNAPVNTAGTAYTLGANVAFPTSAAGSYTIALSGTGDSVSAVTGSSTFTFSGANAVGFTGVSGGTYTISGLATSSQVTAGSGTESYTFSSSGGAFGFSGTSGGTYTLTGLPASSQVSGGAGSESYTFKTSGGALDFSGASGGTYTLDGLPASSQVTGGSGTESFTFTNPAGALTFTGTSGGTYTINGLPNSSQVTAGAGTEVFTINGNGLTGLTLASGSGTATFTLPGTGNSNNTLQGGPGTGSFTLTGDNITYHGATGVDTVTVTGNSNDFIVGTGSETFYDTGTSNTVDFGAVGASPAAPLFVNDSGSSQNAGGSTLASGRATLAGSAIIYTFRDSPTAATSADFTTIRGASGGSTDFLAGGTGGITLIGQGVGNSASFFGSNGIVANVSGALQISNAQLSQSAVPLSGFQIASGQVLVSSPGASASCSGTPIAPFCDVLTDVFSITGPSSGFSTFYAGATIPSGDTYKFSDAGDFNTFIGGTGPATFSSAGNHNTFVAGFGNETFTETTTSQVPSNTIDFSHVPTGQQAGCTSGPCILTINISGAGATVPNFVAELINSAPTALATYTFGGSGGGADFTNFIGSAGGNTIFLGGSGDYTYTGEGTGNTLDFSNLSGISSLTFDVTHAPLPQVQVGAIPETFSGITDLIGLTTGSTTFIGGSTGGYTFDGKGTGNQVIFTSQGPSTTLSVTVTQGGPAVTGGTVTFTIAGGQVLCSDVPVSSLGVASCYPTSLPSGQVQIVAVYTPPTGVTFTGSGFVLTVNNSGGPTSTTTDTVQATPIAGPSLFQGQPVTLSANVSSTGGSVTSGSVSFFLAGSDTPLCSYALSLFSSCSTPSLPAGNYVLLAVYAPGAGFSGSAGTALISVNSPPASSLSNFQYTGGSSFSVDYSVPGGSTGNLCFSTLDQFFPDTQCQLVNGSGTANQTFPLFFGVLPEVSKNDQVFANLTYFSGPTPFSGSSAVVGPLTTAVDEYGFQPTGTSISASVDGVTVSTTTAGTTVNFTVTVTAPANTVPSGGFLTVELVGGTQLCSSVPVPGGATSATLFCSASLPAGTDNILAIYTPPGSTFTGSASVVVLTVNGPTSETSTTGVLPTQDVVSGVVANLSGSTYCTNGTNPCIGGVSVPGGDVLVAAPQSGVSSCSTAGTPLQTFCDALIDITVVTGSAGGHNTFVAGNSTEILADTGSVGGDAINFSAVPTGSPSSTLTVDVNGGNGSFTASVAGGGPTYTFISGGQNFTMFTGSLQGFTTFLAGPNPGYSFTANGSGNVLDFSAATSGVLVNLSGTTHSGVAPGRVGIGAGTDSISGLSNIIGSSAGGNTFYGGSAFPSYTFTGVGTGNTFVAGLSPDTFVDSAAGNTVDFSQLTGFSVVVDRSSTTVSPTLPNNATASNGSNYSFGSAATTFNGAPGGTTFYAGSTTDTFNGFLGATNKLIFQFSPQASLTVCVITFGTCTGGQAQVSAVPQVFFSNIGSFTGLAGGNTTFVAGDGGGFTFTGLGSANMADFSGALHPVNVNLATPTNTVAVSSGPADTISGITTVFGSCSGGNTFVAGTASETFGDIGNTGGPCSVAPAADGINFSALTGTTPSSLLTINASGKQDVLSPYTATFGSATWTFSTGGSNFKIFTGAASGNTVFLVNGSATGFTFNGQASNNTLNLATNTSGLTVDMTTGLATLTGVAGQDSFSDITSVIGSPSGANTFFGGLTGTSFTSSSTSNTLSYLNELAVPVRVDMTTGTVSGLLGSPDTFSFPVGTLIIQGSPRNDTFVGNTRTVIFQGGGGSDSLDLSHLTSGVTVNLNTGSVTGTGIHISFTPCTTATNTQLCLASITGTPGNDTFTMSSAALDNTLPALDITGGGGTDTLDLSKISDQSATIDIVDGLVFGNTTLVSDIIFSGIANFFGTLPGGDYVLAGTGTANIIENGAPGTLDFSALGVPVGVNVTVTTTSGTPTGTAANSLSSLNYTFSGITTFFGTSLSDNFTQTGPGTFNFNGLAGNNTLTLNGLPSSVTVSLTPGVSCDAGNSDGTVVLSGSVNDHFFCMFQVNTGGSAIYIVAPGQTTSLNGGGNGTLELAGSPTGGATINLGTGGVTGGGYNFFFTGMSTILGTPFNDYFIAGPGTFTLDGLAGNNTLTFVPPGGSGPGQAVVVNDSSSPYTIPAGYSNAGTVVPAHTTLGGYGGVITLKGIYNLVASATNADILVADNTNYGSLTGGAGNDRFVLTGADNYLYAGTGNATLDLSLLPGQTSLDLAVSSLQPLGTGAGFLTLAGGNITTVIASPGGSNIWGGSGSLTLLGGPGSDWLAGGTGNQILTGGGGSDTLVGGVGTDTLAGGGSPVTFVPGQGSDTLTSSTTGNTLDYSGAPSAVQVNLSNNLFSVPAGEPFAGSTLLPQAATGGWGSSVNLSSAGITFVRGTNGADIFVTGAGGDNINGIGGSDLFVITGGNNTLTAGPGSGSRFLFEGAGNNSINGGGNGTIDFSQAPAGVNVNLQTGNATGGWGGFQQVLGVLNVIGSQFSDVLVAGGPGGTIIGLNGNDLLIAGPSGGDTLMSSGSGNDTFCAQSSCASGNATGGGDTMIGGSGNDVFFTVNGVPDTINGGAGFNSAFTDPTENSVSNIQQQTVG